MDDGHSLIGRNKNDLLSTGEIAPIVPLIMPKEAKNRERPKTVQHKSRQF
jgi:hypothetical protein